MIAHRYWIYQLAFASFGREQIIKANQPSDKPWKSGRRSLIFAATGLHWIAGAG
jgi:hypothetical protein